MTRLPSRKLLLAGGALAVLALSSPVAQVSAQQNIPDSAFRTNEPLREVPPTRQESAAKRLVSIPDFSSNQVRWVTANGGEFVAVPGSPAPLRQDPAHPFVGNGQGKQPTYRIADLSNPNLKQWVKDAMKKDNDEVLAGKIAFTARQSCRPAGVPNYMLFGGPFYFVQTPKEVLILFEGDQQVRRVYLDVPHSANPKPSWYGESVGHYRATRWSSTPSG